MFDGQLQAKTKEAPAAIRGLTRAEVIERMRERIRQRQEAGPPRTLCCCCK